MLEPAIARANINYRYWRKIRAALWDIQQIEKLRPISQTLLEQAIALADAPMNGQNYERLKALVNRIRSK